MNETDFKQRMIGAIVLIALGVIFIPILLNGEADDGMPMFGSNIPERHKSITNMNPINLSSHIPPLETKEIETIVVDELSPKIVDKVQDKNNTDLNNEPAENQLTQKQSSAREPNENQKNDNKESQVGSKVESKTVTKIAVKKEQKQDIQKIDVNILKATAWVIQVGSFSNKKNALKLQNKLRKKNYHAFVEAVTRQSVTNYRVRIGPEVMKGTSDKILKRLIKEMKINGIVMKYKG